MDGEVSSLLQVTRFFVHACNSANLKSSQVKLNLSLFSHQKLGYNVRESSRHVLNGRPPKDFIRLY